MLKYLLAYIRWGDLTSAQEDKLETLSLKEVLRTPYLIRKY